MDGPVTERAANLGRVDIDEVRDPGAVADQVLRQASTGLTGPPDDDSLHPLERSCGQVVSLAGEESLDSVSRVCECEPGLVVTPGVEGLGHLGESLARSGQSEPEIVILRPASLLVAACFKDSLTSEDDARVWQRAPPPAPQSG